MVEPKSVRTTVSFAVNKPSVLGRDPSRRSATQPPGFFQPRRRRPREEQSCAGRRAPQGPRSKASVQTANAWRAPCWSRPDPMLIWLLTGRQAYRAVLRIPKDEMRRMVEDRMHSRIARLALARFRVDGFVDPSHRLAPAGRPQPALPRLGRRLLRHPRQRPSAPSATTSVNRRPWATGSPSYWLPDPSPIHRPGPGVAERSRVLPPAHQR